MTMSAMPRTASSLDRHPAFGRFVFAGDLDGARLFVTGDVAEFADRNDRVAAGVGSRVTTQRVWAAS
jgi:hypothetical protein